MANITVRYFKVVKIHHSAPDLDVALRGALQAGATAHNREREVAGQTFRLERLIQDNTFYDGEVVRKQTGDMPPEANDDGLQRLSISEGGGIGHCVAFRYSVAYQVIAIQFDNRAVSVNRLLAYLKEFDPTFDYRADPIVRRDAWTKYNTGLPTKFEIQLAQPADLEAVEGPVGTVIQSAQTLSDIYDGPVITIEIKMGRRKGSLTKDAVDSVLRYFTEGAGASQDVRKLSATTSNEDGSEEVDFLKEFLMDKRDISTPEGQPEEHYAIRRATLSSCFRSHNDYIRQVYGGPGDGTA